MSVRNETRYLTSR